jgi:ribonuclease HI
MAQKFYVVWAGRQTGVFTDWATTLSSVDKHPGARYKAFPTRAEAEHAFRAGATSVAKSRANKAASANSENSAVHVAHRFAVSIYCDGACEPNPGNAGSGIVLYRDGKLSELWYGLYNAAGTNNTAELSALLHALRMAEVELATDQAVEVCSDSQYSINCVSVWALGWEKRGWKKPGGEIKNLELIQDCYAIYQRIKTTLHLTHVSAHVGHEGNELADRMAMMGAQRKVTELRLYDETLDVATLLKMRAG